MKKIVFAFLWASLKTVYAQDPLWRQRQVEIHQACQHLVGNLTDYERINYLLKSISKKPLSISKNSRAKKKEGLIRQLKIMHLRSKGLDEESNAFFNFLTQTSFEALKGPLSLALISRLDELDALQQTEISSEKGHSSCSTAENSFLRNP